MLLVRIDLPIVNTHFCIPIFYMAGGRGGGGGSDIQFLDST